MTRDKIEQLCISQVGSGGDVKRFVQSADDEAGVFYRGLIAGHRTVVYVYRNRNYIYIYI